MKILKKLFRKPAITDRYKGSQKWVLHNDDGESQVTHILNVSRVEEGVVEFVEHTSWENGGPDDDNSGYKQISHSFPVNDFHSLVMTHGFILLRDD